MAYKDRSFRARRMNHAERAVLSAILERTQPAIREPLLRQMDRAEVTGACGCGCATVYLDVVPGLDRVDLPSRILGGDDVQFVDTATGELGGGVIVFVDDGFLSGLEFYSYDQPFRDPPHPGDLRFEPRTA